jgi:hypothetical protein
MLLSSLGRIQSESSCFAKDVRKTESTESKGKSNVQRERQREGQGEREREGEEEREREGSKKEG